MTDDKQKIFWLTESCALCLHLNLKMLAIVMLCKIMQLIFITVQQCQYSPVLYDGISLIWLVMVQWLRQWTVFMALIPTEIWWLLKGPVFVTVAPMVQIKLQPSDKECTLCKAFYCCLQMSAA